MANVYSDAAQMGGKVDFRSLRTELEEIASTEFEECWYFDSQRKDARGDSVLASEFYALKFARPRGPQFRVEVYSTKPRNCQCTSCGHRFTQNVQKGVDNGIATMLLTLTMKRQNIERVILLSGDGDFYTSLGYVRNVLEREVWVVGFRGTVSGRGGPGRLGSRGLGKPHSSRSHHHRSIRSHRRRHSRSDRRNRYDRSHRSPRRERSLPRRELPVHGSNSKRSRRSPSPRRDSEEDLGNLPLFDEVNMSCSDDEDDYSCPSLQASPSPSETGVERSPEPALREDGFSFLLASTGDASRTHRLLDWAFGDNV
ncbi:hypothetical protein PI125_g1803 [Phytophthora idaei]|nr:hypothetical protein PI125_g1803 [Phytophthora idaei]